MSSQEIRNYSIDSQVIVSIIKDLEINEYHPQILSNLLEYNYRYTTLLLDDAKTFSKYAKKKNIDVDDVMLAVKMSNEGLLLRPPRDILITSSKDFNKIPLPSIKDSKGLRIPLDSTSFLQTNYSLKYTRKKTTTKSTTIPTEIFKTTNGMKTLNNQKSNFMETKKNDINEGIDECDQNKLPEIQMYEHLPYSDIKFDTFFEDT